MADKRARDRLARAAAAFRIGCLPPLILLTDDVRLSDPLAAACELPRGSMVILRARDAKHIADMMRQLEHIARLRALRILTATGEPDADGIHLSEARAREAVHWRARHPNWIITAAAHSLTAAANARYADAVLISPVFPTRSHPGGATLGPIRTRIIARLTGKPVYALGGIDGGSIRRLAGAKLAGVAAIDALDPATA